VRAKGKAPKALSQGRSPVANGPLRNLSYPIPLPETESMLYIFRSA